MVKPGDRKQVLMTRVGDAVYSSVARLLRQSNTIVRQTPWDDTLLALVKETAFDAIIIGFPVAGAALGRFISVARAEGSACKACGLILLSAPGHEKQAHGFIGRGVNRVVPLNQAAETLAPAIEELIQVAPRVELRAATRVMVNVGSRPLRAFCQTENLSRTGMLLKGFGHYPVGTTLEFEISIPGEAAPICGSAEVSRTANVANERFEGVGARFISFKGSDRIRLETFLQRHLT